MFHEGSLIPHSIIGSVEDFTNVGGESVPVRSATGLAPVPPPPVPISRPLPKHQVIQEWHEQRHLRHIKNWNVCRIA